MRLLTGRALALMPCIVVTRLASGDPRRSADGNLYLDAASKRRKWSVIPRKGFTLHEAPILFLSLSREWALRGLGVVNSAVRNVRNIAERKTCESQSSDGNEPDGRKGMIYARIRGCQ